MLALFWLKWIFFIKAIGEEGRCKEGVNYAIKLIGDLPAVPLEAADLEILRNRQAFIHKSLMC